MNKKCICKIFPFSDNKYKHKHTEVNNGLMVDRRLSWLTEGLLLLSHSVIKQVMVYQEQGDIISLFVQIKMK